MKIKTPIHKFNEKYKLTMIMLKMDILYNIVISISVHCKRNNTHAYVNIICKQYNNEYALHTNTFFYYYLAFNISIILENYCINT